MAKKRKKTKTTPTPIPLPTKAKIAVWLAKWRKLLVAGRANELDRTKLVAEILREHKHDRKSCRTFLTIHLDMHEDSVGRYLDLVPVLKPVKSVTLWEALSPAQLKKLAALAPNERRKLVKAIHRTLKTNGARVLTSTTWRQQYEKVAPHTPKRSSAKGSKNRVGVRGHTRREPASAQQRNDLEFLRHCFGQLANSEPILFAALRAHLPSRALEILHLPTVQPMKLGA